MNGTKCKYIRKRIVPISFNLNEDFVCVPSDMFFLAVITDGYIVFSIDGERCYVGRNMVLCFSPLSNVSILYQYHIKARSLTFSPAFLNININWSVLHSNTYEETAKKFNYPMFKAFFYQNFLYKGVLPLDTYYARRIRNLFTNIIEQISIQPDIRWSCRSRTILYTILEILDFHYDTIFNKEKISDSLVINVLNYIHRNPYETLQLEKLCRLFHTNHTTLTKRFKAATGYTVMGYMLMKRLDHAKFSLRFTELTVQEIALASGFKEITYFSRIFKKYVGDSPLGYRKKTQLGRNSNYKV